MIRAAVFAALLAGPALAETSPYAGQEGREIASLSAADIAALEAGEGWGLAKPAELNGWPGPRHVLDLADQLELTDAQRRGIEAIFTRMQAAARAAGSDYVAAEAGIDAAFRAGTPTAEEIAALAAAAGAALARLRAVHLAAHLETTPLLSRHQRHEYQRLRGYADGGHAGHGGGHGHGD